MERWTRLMVRHRWLVVAAWLVVLLAGGYSNSKLSALLSNTFTMPGTDSERARTILKDHYSDRSDGSFTVVFQVPSSADPDLRARLQGAMARGAKAVPSGKPRPLVPGGPHLLYGDIVSTLSIADAKGYTDDILRALPHGNGVAPYVTGQAAIQHDLDPIFNEDLKKGELFIAVPIALLILLVVFGLSWAVTIPLLFAACTIMGTLGAVYVFAHYITMATYVTNLVQLIGLGIAIDYSLLIVYRYREELHRTESKDEAIVRTMGTAGRAVVSGRSGGVTAAPVQRSIHALIADVRRDPEVRFVRYGPTRPWLDPSGRYAQVVVAGKHEYGEEAAQRFVHRLRDDIVPAARWPAGVRVLAGGGPPQGVDFIDRSYAVFPWLVLAVLVLTYLLLLRAFRSVVLPLKAVILNLLSVA